MNHDSVLGQLSLSKRDKLTPGLGRNKMAGESKGFTWQTGIALGGLAISLFGNWIQY